MRQDYIRLRIHSFIQCFIIESQTKWEEIGKRTNLWFLLTSSHFIAIKFYDFGLFHYSLGFFFFCGVWLLLNVTPSSVIED